ncbi:CsbD family protein [Cyclobacterium salsum]|uniref:CsbD family protein n=1 Tax=Cyclobacterium salsum TaxID=2666329 RepID=UPI001391C47D|nr:CsbD family protein [Cyclobacterium salsum]
MSTNLKLKGNWNELKGKLKAKYGELTDDDLAYSEGQEDQLVGKLQQKTGAAKEELKEMLFTEEKAK